MKYLIIVLMLTGLLSASLQYNYMSGKWENARDNEVLRYNHMDNTHSYENSNSSLRYNYMENTYYYD